MIKLDYVLDRLYSPTYYKIGPGRTLRVNLNFTFPNLDAITPFLPSARGQASQRGTRAGLKRRGHEAATSTPLSGLGEKSSSWISRGLQRIDPETSATVPEPR